MWVPRPTPTSVGVSSVGGRDPTTNNRKDLRMNDETREILREALGDRLANAADAAFNANAKVILNKDQVKRIEDVASKRKSDEQIDHELEEMGF